MEEENAWHCIEGAIKNLSSALQSFPDELKAKALKLLGTQLNNSPEEPPWLCGNGNEKHVTLKQESEENNENVNVSLSSVTAEAGTSLLPAEKRQRGRRKQRAKVDKAISETVSSGIKQGLRSGTRQRTSHVKDQKPARKVTRQSAKVAKRDQKILSSISSTEHTKNSSRTERSKRIVSTSLGTEDNKKVLAMIEPATEDQSLPVNHEAEKQSDSVSDIMASDMKSRKRGRPRKLEVDILEIKKEEPFLNEIVIPETEAKEILTPKKPGRPRQSSYSSGYIPRAKNFRCVECGKMLATKQSYREHQRQHTGEGFVCDNCGQKFTTSSGFMLHKRYHSDDPHMYKCSKCKYIVSSQQLLDDHYQLRHDPNRPKSHICDVCGKAFHGATQLEKHLFSHANTKPFECDQCSFSTAYPGGLEKHKYNVHVADKTLFRCELCGIQLKSKGTYIEHIGRHFNQRKKKCEVCEKTFPNASQLAAHRRCHLEPTVPCEICGKKLRSKHKLKVHELIHTGQKDFACPYCTYVTYVKHNLKKHCLARHKVDYPPLLTQKMKKFKLSEVSSDGLKDPLALKCLRKLNSSLDLSAEEQDGSDSSVSGVATPATNTATTADTTTTSVVKNIKKKKLDTDNSKTELTPMTKVEMTAVSESKTFVTEDKMFVTLSTIDRHAILDFHCPPGTFFPTSLYLPALVNGDQQMT